MAYVRLDWWIPKSRNLNHSYILSNRNFTAFHQVAQVLITDSGEIVFDKQHVQRDVS